MLGVLIVCSVGSWPLRRTQCNMQIRLFTQELYLTTKTILKTIKSTNKVVPNVPVNHKCTLVFVLTHLNYEISKQTRGYPTPFYKKYYTSYVNRYFSIFALNENILYYTCCKLLFNYFRACRWLIVSRNEIGVLD
jgi:hypothetical protein